MATGKSKTGSIIYLNDRTNFRDPETRTVVISAESAPKWAVNPTLFKGRKITATGRIDEYNGKPQVWVEKDADLRVD